MVSKTHSIFIFLTAAVLMMFSACRDEAIDPVNNTGELKVGQKMADFSLEDANAEIVSLSDFKGKTVLVEFWASWCTYCLDEVPELNALYQQYRDRDFEVIGVSIDKDQKRWISKIIETNSQYIHLIDPYGFDSQLLKSYGITVIPKMILLDKDGKILLITMSAAEVREKLVEELG
jgi:peroxiredoxin